MKKTAKKLTLNSATIRKLDAASLEQVGGGGSGKDYSWNCSASCRVANTCSCACSLTDCYE